MPNRIGPPQCGLHHAASIPGIGLLTATAMVAATSGDVSHFKEARHFASSRCDEIDRSLMATRFAPSHIDADNSSGSLPAAPIGTV